MDIDRAQIQLLRAREGEQLSGELRAAHRCLESRAHRLRSLVGREPPLQQFEAAEDCGQQIVEVVRDAAGQPADGLHLLRLRQRRLGRTQRFGSLGDPDLQRAVQFPQRFGGCRALGEMASHLPLAPPRPQRRPHRADQADGVERPFHEHNIAERLGHVQLGQRAAGRGAPCVSTITGRSDHAGWPRRRLLSTAEIRWQERFVRDDDGSRRVVHRITETFNRRADRELRCFPPQEQRRAVGVAARRREQQNWDPLTVRRIVQASSPRSSAGASVRRDTKGSRSAHLGTLRGLRPRESRFRRYEAPGWHHHERRCGVSGQRSPSARAPVFLEKSEHDHCVREIAEVDRAVHGASQAVLRIDEKGHHVVLAEIGKAASCR